MIKRKELKALQDWASDGNRKPLVLRGARQVGKTTLVNEFSKTFDTYLYLNLENSKMVALFEEDNSMEELLMNICLVCGKSRGERTLLFIDEIQNSPKAVARLRYFYEEMPQLYVIAAGSLLESLINVSISFPVGRVQYLVLRPCCFLEFLQAMDKQMLVDAIQTQSISSAIHPMIMDLFNLYTLVGGMPEVVASFARKKEVVPLNTIFESLLISYRDDVEKYAKNETNKNVLRHILKNGWKYAAERITLGNFAQSAYKAREMGEAFRALEKTSLLELVYPTTTYQIPIIQENKRSPKLLWLDTGIVNYAAGIQEEIALSNDIQDAWRGRIAEHIVGQELFTLDNRPSCHRDFWVRDANGVSSEVDFVIQHKNQIIPIEVKSGHNSKLKSLHLFMDKVNHDMAVRVWSQPFSVDNVITHQGKHFRLINLPFYYLSELPAILDKLAKPVQP